MSKKDDFACFFCDYWWLFLILLMLVVAGVLTKNLWAPRVFPPTPTAIPTRTVVPTLTSTAVPTRTSTSTPIPPTEQTLGTGDVQVTLRWVGRNDLDLHVIDPTGEEIYYSYPASQSGGDLDVDSNARCLENITEQSVENIFWPLGDAPVGGYEISVVYFEQCVDPGNTNFTVHVLVDGQVKDFTGQVGSVGERIVVYEFTR